VKKTAKPYPARRAFLLREFQFEEVLRPSDPDLVKRYAEFCYGEGVDTPKRMQSARTALYRDIARMGVDLDLERIATPVKTGSGRGRSAWGHAFKPGAEGLKWLAFET